MLEPTQWQEYTFTPVKIGEHRAYVTRWSGDGTEYYSVHVQGRNASTGIEYTLLDTDSLDDHPSEEDIAEMVAEQEESNV